VIKLFIEMRFLLKYGWSLLFLAVIAIGSGCSTTESENTAQRPWNAPKDWEYGLPPSMMEGR
jgi:hypothetical protein